MNAWTILGIRATTDEREIKRAYAGKLKTTRPEDDPLAFQALRDAYEAALRLARYAAQHGDYEEEDQPPAYTAAYEWDPEQEPGPDSVPATPVYMAAYEFEPLAPMTEARRIWADFLPGAHRNTVQQLRELVVRSDLLDLEVRECFELCALQYCAGEGCDDDFRLVLAEHFQWESNYAFIYREMPEETAAMMARLRDYRSYSR
ncbi:MAG: J domain-containing protein [Pseudomonadota bacterium]